MGALSAGSARAAGAALWARGRLVLPARRTGHLAVPARRWPGWPARTRHWRHAREPPPLTAAPGITPQISGNRAPEVGPAPPDAAAAAVPRMATTGPS